MIITEWLWALWLAVCAGVMIGAFRAHQVGGRKTLVMALAWLCIFLLAAGIASVFEDWFVEPPVLRPEPASDPVFT